MQARQFETFINFFDKNTKGKYTYYYRQLWDSFRVIGDNEVTNKANWGYYFTNQLRANEMPENLQADVTIQIKNWESCNN